MAESRKWSEPALIGDAYERTCSKCGALNVFDEQEGFACFGCGHENHLDSRLYISFRDMKPPRGKPTAD
jgi:hypothetical protein